MPPSTNNSSNGVAKANSATLCPLSELTVRSALDFLGTRRLAVTGKFGWLRLLLRVPCYSASVMGPFCDPPVVGKQLLFKSLTPLDQRVSAMIVRQPRLPLWPLKLSPGKL